MRPLVFLTARTLVNGVKRAVTNPRRLIGLLFASFWLIRFLLFPTRGERSGLDFARLGRAEQLLGSLDLSRILDALVFAGFAFITFFLALGSLSTRNSFRPADVDVLFPTPVEPKLVLIFRIVRDYLLTLITPLFFILIGFRPASAGVKSLKNLAEHPEAINMTLRFATGIWMLVALCWVCINYAASLFVNRSDLASDRNKKVIGWFLGLTLIAVMAYIAYGISQVGSWQDAAAIAESPFPRIVFFTATLATWAVHGIVQADPIALLMGVGGMAAIIVLSLKVASSQAGWMYDQAAVRGFDSVNARRLQQSGDTIGLMTEQARRGKVKAGRSQWISRITVRGPAALLWKEAILMIRSTLFVIILFALITLFITFVPLFAPSSSEEGPGSLFLIFQAFGAFISASALSQAGFIEMLRRVDVQKPLPFSFSSTILFEVIAKALPGALTAWLCSIVAVIVRPSLWQEAIGSALSMPFLIVVICSMTCLVTILFPDFDDPSQRGFRGLMNFVGIIIACTPGVFLFIGLQFLHVSPIIGGLLVAVLNFGIAAVVAGIAGNQYAQFNPNE